MSSCSNVFIRPVYHTFVILADQFSITMAVSCNSTCTLEISVARFSSDDFIPKLYLPTRVSSIMANDLFSFRTLRAFAVQPTRFTQARFSIIKKLRRGNSY